MIIIPLVDNGSIKKDQQSKFIDFMNEMKFY